VKRPIFGLGPLVLGTGAFILGLFLFVGWLLPGTWSAERSIVLAAPPAVLFPLVDAPESWRRWTPWPDSGLVASGPAHGVGARLSWNDPELGEGSFHIVEALPDSLVRYRVEVQGGSMRTDGTMHLRPEAGGTRVVWKEQGDFGANPLMGYWARFMSRAQGAELEKALERLETVAEGGDGEKKAAPADSGSVDAAR
jgi:hypothetical protein